MIIPMIDYLAFGVDIEGYESTINDILPMLQDAKEQAKYNAANKISEKSTIELYSVCFEVMANGAQGYAYILNNDEYQIKLAQFRSNNSDFLPVYINIHSQCLWAYGPKEAYSSIINFLENVLGRVISNKISRLDLCCHTDLISSISLSSDCFKGNYRNSNIRATNRKACGFEFGSRESEIYCRIYDKSLEIVTKRSKLWFMEIWKSMGVTRDEVWNIEFELKRLFFRSFCIASVEDAFMSLKTIWEYCTKKWLEMINRDHTRVENCSVSNEWQWISDAFSSFEDRQLISREGQEVSDAAALIPSMVGYLTTVSARYGCNDIEKALATIKVAGQKYLEARNHTYKSMITEKINLLGDRKRGETDATKDGIHS
jgi:hypothetical protein